MAEHGNKSDLYNNPVSLPTREDGDVVRMADIRKQVGYNMRRLAEGLGSCGSPPCDSTIFSDLSRWPCVQQQKEANEGKEVVLQHIILDLMGSSTSVERSSEAVQRAFRRKRRLLDQSKTVLVSRLALMVLVAILLVVTALLTWYFTSTYMNHSVRSLAYTVRHQILRSSLQTLSSILGQLYDMTVALSYLHQQAYIRTRNLPWAYREKQLRHLNWALFKSQTKLSSVGFFSLEGFATDYTRDKDMEFLFFSNQTNVGNLSIWYMQNVSGSRYGSGFGQPMLNKEGPFVVSSKNLYTETNDQALWSIEPGMYGEPFVSSAVQVRFPENNEVLGLSSVKATFKQLTRHLSTLDLLGGFLYVVWKNGTYGSRLIAVSYNNTGDAWKEPKYASNPVVAAAARYLDLRYSSNVNAEREIHAANVLLVGSRFFIDTMPLDDWLFNDLNLTAVFVVPRGSVMGQIDIQRRTVIGVSVGVAFGILVVGCFLICLLTTKMSTELQLRRELIQQLVAKHQTEQSSNYKSQFLANMSHEFRTPMAGILGLLDLLSCDSLTSEQEISVAQIRRCANGLLALVNNVLDISKVEAGKMELDVASFNLADELESLADMFAAQSLGSGIEVTLDLSDEVPNFVKGDSARIRQIFSNLLSNSIKFTTNGHIIIRGWVDQSLLGIAKGIDQPSKENGICSHREKAFGLITDLEQEKIALVFEVEDTGCGIPAEKRETVFDSFVQLDSSTTRTYGGSGLGLYIVRSWVRKMGGDIWIASKDGPGTLLRFHIVLNKIEDAAVKTVEAVDDKPSSLPSPESLSSLLASPSSPFPPKRLLSAEFIQRTQVLVAMPESVAEEVAVRWLERKGLKVAKVKIWEEIVPTLEKMCKDAYADTRFTSHEWKKAFHGGFNSDLTDCSFSPFDSGSGGSSSRASACMVDMPARPILALIDIALFPAALTTGISQNGLTFCDDGLRDALTNKLETYKYPPPPLLDILGALSRIHNKQNLAVGWVVSPDLGASFKQTLQAAGPSLLMIKPLHGSRLRRLLTLLMKVCKLDPPSSETLSCMSSEPSTPRLAVAHGSCEEGHVVASTTSGGMWSRQPSFEQYANYSHKKSEEGKEVLGENAKSALEKLSNPIVNVIGSQSGTNVLPSFGRNDCSKAGDLYVLDLQNPSHAVCTGHSGDKLEDFTPSTPQSPTSGLITPEGADSTADGLQEARKDGVDVKEFEEEWRGPVIDLSLPERVRKCSRLFLNSTLPFSGSTSTTVPSTAGSSPSHTALTCATSSGVLAGIHILLVEDTPILQHLVSTMLKKLGAKVTVVGDGQQAVTAVAAEAFTPRDICLQESLPVIEGCQTSTANDGFDLILMDCAMPVMDGYTATKAIREAEVSTSRHIPIVALTAHALASDEERCLAVGMDGYLTKPVNCKLMVTTIQELVLKSKRKSSQQEG